MRRSKLDRLIEKNDENSEINYSVIIKAMELLEERKRNQRLETSFKWGTLVKILVPLCCVLIVIVTSVILFYPPNDDSTLPPTIELPNSGEKPEDIYKHYSASEDRQRNIQSIADFNREKNISLRYFDMADSEETIIIHEDNENEKDIDVLLWQRILLLKSYEEIRMYVQLQNNYIFDFLGRFENLGKEREINGVMTKYDTCFDENELLFCTRATFEMDGFKYKVEFLLECEDEWITYLSSIL